MPTKQVTANETEKTNNEVQQGNDRYISGNFDRPLHHLIIQGSGVAGAALAVVHAADIAEMAGMEPSMMFTIIAGGVGYLAGNLVSQILMLIFSDLAQPFVPNSWT